MNLQSLCSMPSVVLALIVRVTLATRAEDRLTLPLRGRCGVGATPIYSGCTHRKQPGVPWRACLARGQGP